MPKYTDRMGSSTSVATTETAITGSPYTPKTNGRLKKVKLVLGKTSAASLIEGGYVIMKSPSFGGVDSYFPFLGEGLHTAPAIITAAVIEHECDLQVKTGVQIQILILHDVTPVTPIVTVYGEFEG